MHAKLALVVTKVVITSLLFLAASRIAFAASPDICRTVSAEDVAKLQDRPAVFTDIDGVLGQYFLLDYGPTNGAFLDMGITYPRKDAALMLNIYNRRGYVIVYMAGRPRQMEVLGKSMCDATLDWLEANGFPIEKGEALLLLRDGATAVTQAKDRGTAMAEWMGSHGTDLFISMADSVKREFNLTPSYGYVDSDVVTDAFITVGIPPGHIFTIGNKGISRLGYRGSHAIVGPESNPGYGKHVTEFIVPQVPGVK